MLQDKNKKAQTVLNMAAIIVIIAGLYLIFIPKDIFMGIVTVLIGASLIVFNKKRQAEG